jgi:hypothetical protein
MYCFYCPKGYAYVGIFEEIGDFSYLWAIVTEIGPDFFLSFLSVGVRWVLCRVCRFSF